MCQKTVCPCPWCGVGDRQACGQLPPTEIGYLEAHGTGTRLGDATEAAALQHVFGAVRSPQSRLVVGAAKSSVSHGEGAAGLTGLLKALLVLHHRTGCPIVHLRRLQPGIAAANTCLQFPTPRQPSCSALLLRTTHMAAIVFLTKMWGQTSFMNCTDWRPLLSARGS